MSESDVAVCGRRPERRQHPVDMLGRGGLVTRHRYVVVVDEPYVDAARLGLIADLRGPARHTDQHRVEETLVDHADPSRRKPGRQGAGAVVHPAGDAGQPVGAVIARIHRGDHRQQNLRGADVAGGLVTADVLFAGLQGQPVGRRAVGVHRDPDQSARQLPRVIGVHGQIAGVWSAESHWHTEPLSAAEGHVSADLAGWCDQRQRQKVCADRDQCTPLVGLAHQIRPVDHFPTSTRQLGDHPEELAVRKAPPAGRR